MKRIITALPVILFLIPCLTAVFFPVFTAAASDQPVLRSSSELDYPPFAIVTSDGHADGFSVELLQAVVRTVGMQINIAVGPWHSIKQQLIDGQLDVLPLVSYSQERDRVLDFSAPYLRMHGTIFIRKGEKRIKSRKDLKDKEVLVMRGDTAHEYALKEKLSDHLVLTESFEEAMQMLSKGKHDAVIIQQLVGLQLLKRLGISNVTNIDMIYEDSLKPSAASLAGFEQKFCLAVKEGDAALLARLNEGLAIAIADGTYDKLYQKWFGPILPPAPISLKRLMVYIFSILVPLLVLFLFIGIGLLKREVAQKTRSLRSEIQERMKAQDEKDRLITDLKKALDEVKTLSGFIPICSGCKKIRDDRGYWNQIESYIKKHSNAEFSHGLCPDCLERLYPDV